MPRRMLLENNSAAKAILYTLLGGAILFSPMGSKVVVAIVKYYLKKWWDEGGPYVPPERDPEQVRQSIYKLRRGNYVRWKYNKRKRTITMELTRKGRKLFEDALLNDITITVSKEWDKRWRFVMFDIPEKSRLFRNVFRDKLKRLGFFQFQKSIWIYPYDCEKEIGFVSEYLGISHCVMTFTASIEKDKILRRYFYREGVLPKRYLDVRYKYLRT